MVNPSFIATHHTTLRREYPPQTSRVISSDIYLFSIGLTALLFADTGAIRSLSSPPLTTAFLTRMVLAQRVPSLFTAAQILRGAPLSVLHFFSPSGCLPHQKGGLPPQRGVSACCDASVFGEKTASRHNRPQRGQHRVSLPWRCTDATRPAGGPHKPSQGLTRSSAFLGCGVQFRWAVNGGVYCDKKSATWFQIF